MNLLLTVCLWFSSLFYGAPEPPEPQQMFPAEAGQQMRYTAFIEMPKASLSGLCVLARQEESVEGILFNEFGLSVISFAYLPAKDKVVLHEVTGFLNRWYIRRVLRKDLLMLIHNLQQGRGEYKNQRRSLTYSLHPMEEIED